MPHYVQVPINRAVPVHIPVAVNRPGDLVILKIYTIFKIRPIFNLYFKFFTVPVEILKPYTVHKPYPVPYSVHHQKHIIQRPVSASHGWGALGGLSGLSGLGNLGNLGNLGGWGGLGGGHGHSGSTRVIHVNLGHSLGHSQSLGHSGGHVQHSHDLPWGGSSW